MMPTPFSESLFMTLTLSAFYFLEKGKELHSTLLGFFAALTRSNGFLIGIPFFYNFIKKRTIASFCQVLFVFLPYLLFNLFGIIYTGIFHVSNVVYTQYWGKPSFFLFQLFDIELGYALLFSIEFCLILVPFVYLFSSKELLMDVFSFGLKGNRIDAKYYGYSLIQLLVILFFAIISNIHRYAIAILPLYWVFAKVWTKKPRIGMFFVGLMMILLIVGTVLFSTWRWYW